MGPAAGAHRPRVARAGSRPVPDCSVPRPRSTMTHVMVPDGVLPWWLSAAGWVLAAVLLGVALWRLRGQPAARMVPLVGVVTALMVVVMSFELVPIGYELHFTVLAGMIVGPWYGAI